MTRQQLFDRLFYWSYWSTLQANGHLDQHQYAIANRLRVRLRRS